MSDTEHTVTDWVPADAINEAVTVAVADFIEQLDDLRAELAEEKAAHAKTRDNFETCSEQWAAEVKQLRMDIEWHRVQQVQHLDEIKALRAQLNDIARGQGVAWPAGASLPAGPPLPRRVPMRAAFEVGEFPAIVQPAPMTDPALDDRTEGGQP